jgi:integrase
MAKQFLRPSTYKNYKTDEYERLFKTRLGDLRLRDFRTAHGQRLLSAIAKDNPELGHKTLLRLKSFLSGVFKHARAEGYLDDENPMRDVTLPRSVRRVKFKGDKYTAQEITTLLFNTYSSDYAGHMAFAAVATAAFTGLRLAELRGLQWRDFTGDRLSVERTVWRTKQGLPKTESSENTVPVLPILKATLESHRLYLEGLPEEGNLGKDLKPTDVRWRAPCNIDELAEPRAPHNHSTADSLRGLPLAEASARRNTRRRPCFQVGRIDTEVERLARLPAFARDKSLHSRCQAEGDPGDLASQRSRHDPRLLC